MRQGRDRLWYPDSFTFRSVTATSTYSHSFFWPVCPCQSGVTVRSLPDSTGFADKVFHAFPTQPNRCRSPFSSCSDWFLHQIHKEPSRLFPTRSSFPSVAASSCVPARTFFNPVPVPCFIFPRTASRRENGQAGDTIRTSRTRQRTTVSGRPEIFCKTVPYELILFHPFRQFSFCNLETL